MPCKKFHSIPFEYCGLCRRCGPVKKYNVWMPDNTPQKAGFRLILTAVFVGLLAATAGFSFWKVIQGPPQAADMSLIILPEPREIGGFSLLDGDGKTFALDNLREKWSLMFFGFTHCPDVCPSVMYDLDQVITALQQEGQAPPALQVVFVSVDPERDTPEKLGEYARYFNPGFIGIGGSQEQLEPLTRQLSIGVEIEEHEPGAQNYGIYHTSAVMLIDPKGRLAGVFPAPHDPEKMARDLASLL